jgi:glucose dehydrogenase
MRLIAVHRAARASAASHSDTPSPSPSEPRSRAEPRSDMRPAARWALYIFVALLVLIGALMSAGGAWLIILGGSWYYILAGVALIVSGVLMGRQRLSGLILYWFTFAATVVWALWEVGPEPWALMPRVLAPAVLALISLAFLPVLHRHATDYAQRKEAT